MKTWESAETMVAVDVLGAPWPTIEDALRHIARDYFNSTLAWRATLDPQLTSVGGWEYEASEETSAEPIKILAATYDKAPLIPLTTSEFMRERAQVPGNGIPKFMSFDGELLRIWPPALNAGREVWIEAAFRPTLTSRGLPDEVWSEHIDAIVEGVKWKLKSMPDKPFNDGPGAKMAYSLYRAAKATAAVAAVKGYTRARTNAVGRFF